MRNTFATGRGGASLVSDATETTTVGVIVAETGVTNSANLHTRKETTEEPFASTK